MWSIVFFVNKKSLELVQAFCEASRGSHLPSGNSQNSAIKSWPKLWCADSETISKPAFVYKQTQLGDLIAGVHNH